MMKHVRTRIVEAIRNGSPCRLLATLRGYHVGSPLAGVNSAHCRQTVNWDLLGFVNGATSSVTSCSQPGGRAGRLLTSQGQRQQRQHPHDKPIYPAWKDSGLSALESGQRFSRALSGRDMVRPAPDPMLSTPPRRRSTMPGTNAEVRFAIRIPRERRTAAVASIARRSVFDVVYHQHLDRRFALLQLQPELFFERLRQCRMWERIGIIPLAGRPLEPDVVVAVQPR